MRTKLPTEQVFAAIRGNELPGEAWKECVGIFRHSAPAAIWEKLPSLNIDSDIVAANEWLHAQLARLQFPSGIYLGLDTLNMNEGRGKNVEIGATTQCDPLVDSKDWVWSKLQYGDGFLINGLYEMHQEFSRDEWCRQTASIPLRSVFAFADYFVFLAYSGIVLGHAFRRISCDGNLLAIWGFHDGTLHLLGRKTRNGFAFLCM